MKSNQTQESASTIRSGGSLTSTPPFVPCSNKPNSNENKRHELSDNELSDNELSGNELPGNWKRSMRTAIRSSGDLRRYVGIAAAGDRQQAGSASAEQDFPTFVPLEYASRIRRGDLSDPILRQVLAVPDEELTVPGFGCDPVGDLDATAGGGLIHKYQGRALLITTAACGVHCRYCFRRNFPYSAQSSRSREYQPAIERIAADESIEEVILSGGDPLTLDDSAIDRLVSQIESVEHVRRLRIHTRMPIVIPSRVTDELISRLSSSRLTVWTVVHCNHAAEVDAAVKSAFDAFVENGLPLLNQAVLLRGVNDDFETLRNLFERLIDCRVMPYYLHHLDRAAGTAHFEVDLEFGRSLMERLRGVLPGYAVPQYVVEQAGQPNKTPL